MDTQKPLEGWKLRAYIKEFDMSFGVNGAELFSPDGGKVCGLNPLSIANLAGMRDVVEKLGGTYECVDT